MPYRRRLLPFLAAALLSVVLAAPGADAQAPAAGAPAGDPTAQLDQIKAKLDASQADREKIQGQIDTLQATIADTDAQVKALESKIAEAESGVSQRRGRIGGMAKQMYRRPLSGLLPFLQNLEPNDAILARVYLRRTVGDETNALDAYQKARDSTTKMQDDLVAQQRKLTADRDEQSRLKGAVEASIRKDQANVEQLNATLNQARLSGNLPWSVYSLCPAAPRTGVPSPQNLEDWAVWTLKSIAARTKRPESDVVTREHVVALVAFAWGEGGGFDNHYGWFNPLNLNGFWRVFPELGAVASGHGTDNYPTFDAGVEASARALTYHNFKRLTNQLLNPSSTAMDFHNALAAPDSVAGDQPWSDNDPAHLGVYTKLIQMVQANWPKFAGKTFGGHDQPPIPGVPRPPTGMSIPGSLGAPLSC